MQKGVKKALAWPYLLIRSKVLGCLLLLGLLSGCIHSAQTRPVSNLKRWHSIAVQDDDERLHQIIIVCRSLTPDDPARPALRKEILTALNKRVQADLAAGHQTQALNNFRQALSLFDAIDLTSATLTAPELEEMAQALIKAF